MSWVTRCTATSWIKNQPHIYNSYFDMSMTVAETASNFNHALLRAYLLRSRADDPVFQSALLEEAFVNFHRYLFIMPTLIGVDMTQPAPVEKAFGVLSDMVDRLESLAD